jgi:hypothetical protein
MPFDFGAIRSRIKTSQARAQEAAQLARLRFDSGVTDSVNVMRSTHRQEMASVSGGAALICRITGSKNTTGAITCVYRAMNSCHFPWPRCLPTIASIERAKRIARQRGIPSQPIHPRSRHEQAV